MPKIRKVILLIVEGITDKVSLEGILPHLIDNEEITFQISDGDITTKPGITSQNVIERINDHIIQVLESKHFKKSDITLVAHLIDTDGAFIPESAIVYADIEHIQYSSDKIETAHIDATKIRNQNKAAALCKLSATSKINTMNYSAYFFSSNLEHVFHNIQRYLSKEEKMVLAENFADQYADSPEEFLNFISSTDFKVEGIYNSTWDFIQKDNNSLNRYCNFHLFFDI